MLILPLLVLGINSASHAENQKELNNPAPSRGVPGKPEQNHSSKTNQKASQDKRGTESNPLVIKGIPSQKTPQEAAEDREERNKKTALDQELNFYTGIQAGITCLIFIAMIVQVALFKWQLNIMNDTLKSTKDVSDATIASSIPILSPYIVGGDPHPLPTVADRIYPSHAQPRTFESLIHFVFENFGKTPGIIREVRADIFLCPNDVLPQDVEVSTLPIIDYQSIVPGEVRRNDIEMAVAEFRKQVTLTVSQFNELTVEAVSGQFQRYAFIGQVIYDDFLGQRHTRHFCIKLRWFIKDGKPAIFQRVRGGGAYNQINRQPIPKDDPFYQD